YFQFNFFFQAEDGIRDRNVTGVQTCALPIFIAKSKFSTLLSMSFIVPIMYTFSGIYNFSSSSSSDEYCVFTAPDLPRYPGSTAKKSSPKLFEISPRLISSITNTCAVPVPVSLGGS